MIVVGVDPGIKGAIAAFNSVTGGLAVLDVPTLVPNPARPTKRDVDQIALARIVDTIRAAGPIDIVMIEKVGAMPGNGGVSLFNFGFVTGALHAAFAAKRCRIETVRPEKWKRAMGLSSDKNVSREMARMIFPTYADVFKRKKDDGRAEAALLALYATRNLI